MKTRITCGKGTGPLGLLHFLGQYVQKVLTDSAPEHNFCVGARATATRAAKAYKTWFTHSNYLSASDRTAASQR